MRTLDRYVTGLYVYAFGVFTLAFLLLYVLIDFVNRINDFINLPSIADRFAFFVEFYALRIPLFLITLLPIVTLFAAMFTCHRLAKSNELVPMVASGVSVRRVTAPFFAAGLLVALSIAGLEEWVVPRLGAKIVHSENVLRRGDTESTVFVRDRAGDTFYFKTYRYSNFEAESVSVAQFGPKRQIEQLVVASRAVCASPPAGGRPGAWIFFNGQRTRYGENLERGETIPLPPDGHRLETDLDPVDLTRAEKVATTYQPLRQIRRLMRENPENPIFPLRLHSRMAAPLGSVLLLLLGIPFIVRLERQNLFLGVGICLVICSGYYVTQFLCLDACVKGALGPPAAGWLPTALFGALGGGLFYGKLRT